MELYLSQLILEVTRRCNMACDHCLRGDAQAIDMSTDVIDRVLDSVTGHGISTVTFTGGEPTLNVPAIQYFVDQVKARRIGVGSFYVVTNGKVESLPLLHALIDLYAHCDEPEMSGLVISTDDYHEGVDDPRIYKALKFFNAEGHGPSDNRYVIQEGRALENGIGERESKPESWELDVNDDYVSVNSTLHVSANGNVICGCDYSFETIDRDHVGNILRESLKDIISRQVEAHALKEAA